MDRLERKTNLKRFLMISLGAHAAIIILLAIKSFVFPSRPKEYIPSLRVDLVALPDRKATEKIEIAPKKEEPKETAASEKKLKPKVEVKNKPKSPGDFVVKKKKPKSKNESKASDHLKNALDRIKALERVKSLQVSEPIKGNQVSKGSSISGEAKTSLETTYFDVVLERVRTHWELPQWLQDQNLSAKVLIFIASDGKLRHYEFTQPSGNAQFDQEVKRTLEVATPFEPPPSEIASDLSREGVILGFPL